MPSGLGTAVTRNTAIPIGGRGDRMGLSRLGRAPLLLSQQALFVVVVGVVTVRYHRFEDPMVSRYPSSS